MSDRSREFFVFLFFLLVAAVFWMLQTLDETLEKGVSVRLELVNVPEDVVILSPLPDEVRAVVSDKGMSLVHYIRYGVEPLQISFSDYDNGANYGRVMLQGSDMQKMLQGCLLGTSKVVSLSPDTVELCYNRGQCKTVPVRVVGQIDVSPECYLLDVQTTPSEVLVNALPAVLDTLTAVCTTPVALEGVAGNTTKEVRLQGMRGAKYDTESVKVDVKVDVYVEKTVEVPIHTSNFPADKSLKTFPSEVQVVYTIGYAQSKDIKEEDFMILLTYEQILGYQKEGKTKLPLTLRNMPEGVKNVRIEPKEVDYLIEQRDGEEEEDEEE